MFYSHQLLARKAPLGQIWMAATMHAKINRKKLDKLNLIQICEEILNPSVPMALRLSGILMGGVVIVYERKVKLLYDDVTRLLVEINEAWKVKTVPDPTVLPKGKNQARREAVTLPDNQETDVGDIEQTLNYSYPATAMGFQQSAYFAMRFDDMEEPQIPNNHEEADMGQQFHQADVENITLFEQYSSFQANTDTYDRFERFDIDGEDETQLNFFNSGEGADIPNAPIPSPPDQHEKRASETPREMVNDQGNQDIQVEQNMQGPVTRKSRTAAFMMDYEQTIVPGHVYQSWLQDTSDLVAGGGRRRKARRTTMASTKISRLMELPPTLLSDALCNEWDGNVPYSKPLHELWSKSTQIQNSSGSPSAAAPTRMRRRSSSSPHANTPNHNQTEHHFEDFNDGGEFQPFPAPPERLRKDRLHDDVSIEDLMARVQANLTGAEFGAADPSVMVTPGQSASGVRRPVSTFLDTETNKEYDDNYLFILGDDVRSIPSSASGRDVLSSNSDIKSKRSNKKRPFSSSENGNIGLEPVAEEFTWHHPDPNFRLSTLDENGPTPDHDLLVETGHTQTQRPIFTHSDERITESIQKQMKTHFETPGSAQEESINKLAVGMNRKAAAMLFYQTCVLATRDVLKVDQSQPYGDIFISRGPKM